MNTDGSSGSMIWRVAAANTGAADDPVVWSNYIQLTSTGFTSSAAIFESGQSLSAKYVGVANSQSITGAKTFSNVLILNSAGTATATSTTHALQLGPTAGINLIASRNRVMVRDNGVAGDLYLGTPASSVYCDGALISTRKMVGSTSNLAVSGFGIIATVLTNAADTQVMMNFYSGTFAVVGTITSTTTSTAYNTSSDYRMKTDVQSVTDAQAIAVIDALNPVTFKWKSDIEFNPATATTDWGFIAHEVQDINPRAVYGHKDATSFQLGVELDIYQSMDYSKLTSHNTAGIKATLALIRQQREVIDGLTTTVIAQQTAIDNINAYILTQQ
jgi:hypothetical protein